MKTKDWDKRNVEYSNSKELVVRQKFRVLDSVTNLDGSKFVVDSFSVRNGRTDEIWNYVMTCAMSSGVPSGSPVINVYNEDMVLIFQFDFGTLATVPPCMTYAIVEDEILICCPGLPPVWGLVGSGLTIANLTTPTNQNTSSVSSFPTGICISWAGRAVVSDGAGLYFSDALDPRAYTGANFINPPGEFIFDMHINSGGSLILVTSNGVYALPEDASYSGIGGIVLPVWTKLTDYSAVGYRKSVSFKGRVYGLTARGIQLIDEKTTEELQLSEKVGSRFKYGRIDYQDYREGFLCKYNDGVIVCTGKFACFVDFVNGIRSWNYFESHDSMNIRGTLKEHDGSDIFLINGYAAIKNGNNGRDGTGELTSSGSNTNPMAIIASRILGSPKLSPVIRAVIFATNSSLQDLKISVNNSLKEFFSKEQSPSWGNSSNPWSSSVQVSELAMKSYDKPFAIRGDEITIEIGIAEYPSLIPQIIDVAYKGPGKERPSR